MKVSIITVCYNSASTIENSIKSVLSQNYKNIEYIIIDGNSNDNTLEIVSKYSSKISKIISDPDEGIYDAMNKGIALASGDIIGILNSDDCYSNQNVIKQVVERFQQNNPDMVFADLLIVNEDNKILRCCSAKRFSPYKLKFGIMPPHPTLFVKKQIYQKYGCYRLDYKLAADYEMFVRLLLTNKVKYSYINSYVVNMLVGGASTSSLASNLVINRETKKALEDNRVRANYLYIFSKYPKKVLELVKGRLLNFFKKID